MTAHAPQHPDRPAAAPAAGGAPAATHTAAGDRPGTHRGQTGTTEVIVVSGGHGVPASRTADLPADATVIAADSGLDTAMRLGLTVDLVVGDMDSVNPSTLAAAERDGVEVQRHPTAKDATDLALALDAACALKPRTVTVLGGDGGRLDHLLAAAWLLAAERYAASRLVGLFGPATLTVIRQAAALSGQPGELVTLLAAHGEACGVHTDGLAYPLAGQTLRPGSSLGVSNTLTGTRATVQLSAGVLLAIQPGLEAAHPGTQPTTTGTQPTTTGTQPTTTGGHPRGGHR